ncbi:hypothetical protein TNCV_4279301 [Trichonephila clavipes]|nr:hypothetical protein TNCV_4279301 [Trichonephila clavipes]
MEGRCPFPQSPFLLPCGQLEIELTTGPSWLKAFFSPPFLLEGVSTPLFANQSDSSEVQDKGGEKIVWWCFYDRTFLSIGEEKEVRKCRLVFRPPNDSFSPIKVKNPNK